MEHILDAVSWAKSVIRSWQFPHLWQTSAKEFLVSNFPPSNMKRYEKDTLESHWLFFKSQCSSSGLLHGHPNYLPDPPVARCVDRQQLLYQFANGGNLGRIKSVHALWIDGYTDPASLWVHHEGRLQQMVHPGRRRPPKTCKDHILRPVPNRFPKEWINWLTDSTQRNHLRIQGSVCWHWYPALGSRSLARKKGVQRGSMPLIKKEGKAGSHDQAPCNLKAVYDTIQVPSGNWMRLGKSPFSRFFKRSIINFLELHGPSPLNYNEITQGGRKSQRFPVRAAVDRWTEWWHPSTRLWPPTAACCSDHLVTHGAWRVLCVFICFHLFIFISPAFHIIRRVRVTKKVTLAPRSMTCCD